MGVRDGGVADGPGRGRPGGDPVWDAIRAAIEPGDETATRIIDAALECFVEVGVRRTTMSQIARVAGIGVATVYRRFAQKDQLVRVVLLREVGRFLGELDATMHHADDVAAELVESFTLFVTRAGERPLLLQVMRGDPEASLPFLTDRAVLDLGRRVIAGKIRQWQDRGELAGYDADVLAEVYARLAQSLILTPGGAIPDSDEAATREFAQRYLVGLLGSRRLVP